MEVDVLAGHLAVAGDDAPSVIVNLAAATICFLGQCHNALIGADTPVGLFDLKHYATEQRGYGGDILVFEETENKLFAIHRLIDVSGQNRKKRIKSADPAKRLITAGCINLEPKIYEKLVDCCYDSKVEIKDESKSAAVVPKSPDVHEDNGAGEPGNPGSHVPPDHQQ